MRRRNWFVAALLGAALAAGFAVVASLTSRATTTSGENPLWQIGDAWIPANTGQCGAPAFPTPTSADFALVKNGTSCERNQLNPVGNGGSGAYLLTPGKSYTFSFQTVTRMGIDTGKFTQRLVWQIHDYGCGTSPYTVLGIQNMTGAPDGQTWYFQTGAQGKSVVTLPYTEGATDSWKITVIPESSDTGHVTASRNGAQFIDQQDQVFACGAAPFWNFGPYQWNWVARGSGVSSLTQVGIRFNYMELTTP